MNYGYIMFQASEDTSKVLVAIKNMLYGTAEQDPQAEMVAQLALEMYNHNMLFNLVDNLSKIDFEVTPTGYIEYDSVVIYKTTFVVIVVV